MGITLAIGFLCSMLVVVPLVVLLFFIDKAGRQYSVCWWCVVGMFAVVCLATFTYVLSWPFYSQTIHQTPNPGGPSGSVFLGVLFWILLWTVVLPSFPALFLLGLFPPRLYGQRRRYALTIAIGIYSAILAGLILVKYQVYMADYRIEKAKPKQSPFERFEHLRTNPAGEADRAGVE